MSIKTLQNLTPKLAKKFGNTAILVEKVKSAVYDPIEGGYPYTETKHDILAIVDNYTSNELVSGLINMDDLSLQISSEFNVTKEWIVEYEGKEWNIINISKQKNKDTNLYYILQIRSK